MNACDLPLLRVTHTPGPRLHPVQERLHDQVHDRLPDLLADLLRSGTTSNAALERLIDDYARFHLVLVVLGGAFAIAMAWWALRTSGRGRIAPAVFALAALVLVAANLSNALDPRRGFAGAVDAIPSPRAGSRAAELQQAFADWLRSGRRAEPSAVRDAVAERLSWQRPKAVASAVLLAVVAVATSRGRGRVPRAAGTIVCLVLAAMVIGNTQASIAPLTLTMVGG